MEAAKIDWASIESVFVVDQVYEEINAPQWVDFLAPHYHPYADDGDDWFCRRDCKHPKTAEDFLKSTPTSKLLRSVSVSKLMGLGDWSRKRDANLKRRGQGQGQGQCEDISENQDPNYTTPPPHHHHHHHHHKSKSFKQAIKSSAQKEIEEEEAELSETSLLNDSQTQKPGTRRLKTTLSAKDLFGPGGKDILGKITDFCNELKKMASTNRPKDGECEQDMTLRGRANPEAEVVLNKAKEEQERDKARKPLLEVTKDRYEATAGIRSSPSSKHKLRKNKKFDDAENIPVFLDLKNVKRQQDEEKLLPIRTNPPTPQGFSAIRDNSKTTPSKVPKSRLKERDVLEELEHNKLVREELGEMSHTNTHTNTNEESSPIAGKEGRTLDVFWFLKPCTL